MYEDRLKAYCRGYSALRYRIPSHTVPDESLVQKIRGLTQWNLMYKTPLNRDVVISNSLCLINGVTWKPYAHVHLEQWINHSTKEQPSLVLDFEPRNTWQTYLNCTNILGHSGWTP